MSDFFLSFFLSFFFLFFTNAITFDVKACFVTAYYMLLVTNTEWQPWEFPNIRTWYIIIYMCVSVCVGRCGYRKQLNVRRELDNQNFRKPYKAWN